MPGYDSGAIARACVLLAVCEGVSTVCTSACLLGISINDIFSILFCVLLCLFAVIFAILAWKSVNDPIMRCYSIAGAVLMPAAGVSCVLVDFNFIASRHPAEKSPLFMLIAAGILVNFSINMIQLIKFASCFNFKDRLLTSNKQVTVLLVLNIVLGLVLGLIFGLVDPEGNEDTVPYKNKMTNVTVVFLFVGLVSGAAFGFFNEHETQTIQNSGLKQALAADIQYDQM
jgi:hypothetical protein